jgi:gliding motility-associated-like protein
MPCSKNGYVAALILVLCCCLIPAARATHIVGGEVTYTDLGAVFGGHRYQIRLSIYEDCLNGTPSAIAADAPAFIGVFSGSTQILIDSARIDTFFTVPANFSNECVANAPPICLIKKSFVYYFVLPPSDSGYTIAYQRCCRNAALQNIQEPANSGATYFCTIPPTPYAANNSAVFSNFPPQIICVNTPLVYNNAATDADHDSLSYELCSSYWSPNGLPNDTIIPPPFQKATYNSPYTYIYPLTAYPLIGIDPRTGLLTCTPNRVGRYLVTVCCHEWRNGVMINTIQREFQFVVTDCSKAVQADIPILANLPNTYQLNCTDNVIHFRNTSRGGTSWRWTFGVPGELTDTSVEFEPTFVYPDTGTYSVKLVANPGSNCADSIVRQVMIYPTFKTDFEIAGTQCPGAQLLFIDKTESVSRPLLYWKWHFGDGDSATDQNTTHAYAQSGIYNVLLESQNVRGCTDSTIRHLTIDNFRPNAGKDTIIVKDEHILFHATGGISYTWRPATALTDSVGSSPTGYYPDTGRYTYTVHVISPYGCIGDDSITVTVVGNAAFLVPTAFTPNGDGRNDVFRPVAIGYRSLNYFRVYNRWGQEIYFGQSLDNGWDGTYRGHQADMGTYYWEISYTDRFGLPGKMKGDVTLVR